MQAILLDRLNSKHTEKTQFPGFLRIFWKHYCPNREIRVRLSSSLLNKPSQTVPSAAMYWFADARSLPTMLPVS
jgi:hypothetical protein